MSVVKINAISVPEGTVFTLQLDRATTVPGR